MKKVLSFTLAVVLAFSLLLGSAFASSGVTVVAPDTFISWGSAGDLTSLAVPSAAVSDGNKYIIYQVRDWVVSYFRVRFVIDSFTRGDPVEGETLSWTRYTGEWGLGVNAALEPSSYEVEYHAAEEYTYSQNFLHLPVKSNFDYYDANGELIISGSGYVNDFEGLMDLTLTDGTVIQVPRRLVGNQFVVVRSASDSSQYKIWNFGTPDTLDGIYEGAAGVNYSTSVGSVSVASSVVSVAGYTVDLSLSSIDFALYPYVYVYYNKSSGVSGSVYASVSPCYVNTSTSRSRFDSSTCLQPYVFRGSDAGTWLNIQEFPNGANVPFGSVDYVSSNFPLLDVDGNLVKASSFSLSAADGWSWTSWLYTTDILDITQYGDIVYQTFDYPLSNPDPDPSPSPGGTPDDSNNGLFAWLKTQWVFLLQKLQNIVDAIQTLTFDLDPYPDRTKPILDDFFEHIFPNRVSSDDVVGIGSVLDKMGGWFNTGYGLSDLFGVFDDEGFDSWFSNETLVALDSVGSDE